MMLLLTLFACTFTKTRIHVEDHLDNTAVMAFAKPVYLSQLEEQDRFRTNTTVGNITFSGGYVTETTEEGMFNVSKEVALSAEQKYTSHADRWLGELLLSEVEFSAPLPERHERRGTSRLDGHDNASLPRVTLTPQPLEGEASQVTLVPVVASYYSHNGGWFFGQEWGTGAGARIRVLLVKYAPDGAVLGWLDVDGSRTSERVFSPTGPQLQDLLIALEKKVGRKLKRAL